MNKRPLKLKPGVLVALRTKISGGIHYQREDLGEVREGDTETSEWTTKRIIDDVPEWERAKQARNKAGSLIRGACITTNFGLLCPADDSDRLDAAIAEARRIIAAHNDRADATYISVNVLRGTIASTDEEAAESIATEVKDLLRDMERGVKGLDVEAARKAATNAKKLGAMLDSGQQERLGAAVEATRAAARQIVKRVKDEGQQVIEEIIAENMTPVTTARIAFLDTTATPAPAADAMPAVNVQRAAEIEVDDYSKAPPEEERDALLAEEREEAAMTPAAAPARDLDLGSD